jgi:hypothetical protein
LTGPPAARPGTQEARGAGPRSRNTENPNYVRVLSPVSNGTGIFKREKAEHYVKKGRAEWVGDDQLQLRLLMSHPKNVEAARRARAVDRGYDSVTCDFRLFVGMSDGAAVWKIERLSSKLEQVSICSGGDDARTI